MPQSSSTKIFSTEVFTGDIPVRISATVKNSAHSTHIKISVSKNGEVFITKPSYVSLAKAHEFFLGNANWIAQKLSQCQPKQSLAQYLKRQNRIFAFGKNHILKTEKSETLSTVIENLAAGEILFAYQNDFELERLFICFAKKAVQYAAQERAKALNIPFKRIEIRSQKSRWASRSSSGTLSFNWRIALLSEDLQNYVICHELAHEKFMDHSVSFWMYLNSFCPNAKRLDKTLTKFGSEIFGIAEQTPA